MSEPNGGLWSSNVPISQCLNMVLHEGGIPVVLDLLAEDIVVNANLKLEVLSLLKTNCYSDALGLAVAAGDVKTVTRYLDTHPDGVSVYRCIYVQYT